MPQRAQKSLNVRIDPAQQRPAAPVLHVLAGRSCQAADLLILAAVLLGLMLLAPVPFPKPVPAPYAAARDLLLALLCLGTWRTILWSIGLYSSVRVQTLVAYGFRCLIALNSCTAVLGLVGVVLRTRVDLWHTLGLFWSLSLLGMAAVRGIILLCFGSILPASRAHRRDHDTYEAEAGEAGRTTSRLDEACLGSLDPEQQHPPRAPEPLRFPDSA